MTETKSQLVHPLQLQREHHEAWIHLAETAATPNAFLHPLFVLPAVRHLPHADRVRLLVTGSSQDQWNALALVVPGSRWRRLPLPALATWAHDQQGLGTPLLSGDDPDCAAADLMAAIRQQAPRATLFGLDEQLAGSRTSMALEQAMAQAGWRRTIWRSSQRAALMRTPEPVPSLSEPGRLRSKRRRLERIAGPLKVLDCSGVDRAEMGARTLLQLEESGWKGRAGTAMAQRSGEANMLLEIARGAAQHGVLRSLILTAGETPVAAQLDLVAGDTWFHWKTAYDEAHSAFSPGRLLLTHVLERFNEENLQCWDACTVPDHPVMDRLLPHRRTISEVAATRGPVSMAVVRSGRAVRSMRDRAR